MNAYKNVNVPVSAKVLDELKTAINLKVTDEHSFQLTYEAPDRSDAMNVTNKLSELFVVSASASSQQKTQDAASAIDDQLSALKGRLESRIQGRAGRADHERQVTRRGQARRVEAKGAGAGSSVYAEASRGHPDQENNRRAGKSGRSPAAEEQSR